MFIVGTAVIVLAVLGLALVQRGRLERDGATRRLGAAVLATCLVGVGTLVSATGASAAIVPTVNLATAANYAVLGASAVTNTGPSVLNGGLGLSPGPAIDGFPPGLVVPPATTDENNAAAAQAQADLTTAYVDAANRPINATTTADLANLTLPGGVYAGPDKGALGLSGPLVLDGAGDPTTVFIFQTDSSLTTASSSTVSLINGAQECNVFWQVGSSATLGTDSVFVGNILALAAVTVTTGVTVHGRALARTEAVTLDTDTFVAPTCDLETPVTTLPVTTLPDTTLPDTTLPVTTLPVTTLPVTTLPVTTLPVTTLPVTTLPVTTLPVTTLPVTTLPDTTLPDTTLPDTTVLPAPTTTVSIPVAPAPSTSAPSTSIADTGGSSTTTTSAGGTASTVAASTTTMAAGTQVTVTTGDLPRTGSSVAGSVLVAAGFIALGVLAIFGARARRGEDLA